MQKPVKIFNLRGEKLQISLAQYFPNKPFFRKLVGGKRKIIIDLQNLLLPGGVPNTIIYFTRQVDIGKFALQSIKLPKLRILIFWGSEMRLAKKKAPPPVAFPEIPMYLFFLKNWTNYSGISGKASGGGAFFFASLISDPKSQEKSHFG